MNRTLSAEEFIRQKESQFLRERIRTWSFKTVDISGATHYWKRQAWTFMQQSNYPEKVFILERLERARIQGTPRRSSARVGDIEYRLGYFIVNRNGKWWWGQSCPLMPAEDFWRLVEIAKREGTLLEPDESGSR